MLPKTHIISGLLFSLILFVIFPAIDLFGMAIIFLSSVLIDLDHYLYFVYKTRTFNPKRSFDWFFINKDKFRKMSAEDKNKIYTGLCFLHGLESFIVLIILLLIFPTHSIFFLYILLGFLFHNILDAVDLYIRDYRYDKVISFTYAVYNSRNKKLLQEI